MYLSDFHILRPCYQTAQADALEWLLAAHTQAEAMKNQLPLDSPRIHSFREQLKERLYHVSCKPGVIEYRGHALSDFLHRNWNEMSIYNLSDSGQGADIALRNQKYAAIVDDAVLQMYANEDESPQNLIHVSCTGYASPSGAQKLVSNKQWGRQTTVTHAYHMGCYGALPALRMASGFQNHRSDIVHTEVCSLHYNPARHELDQLVVHSLFADGFIKYSVFSQKPKGSSLKILGIKEHLIPDSSDLMLWSLGTYGFFFFLSKEIPQYIARSLAVFFKDLCSAAQVNEQELLDQALFAIHPGGPKIIKYIQKFFGCSESQIKISYEILKRFGNMSSCTLPHMWAEICRDDSIPAKTRVVSLAFGPGLTLAGIILEKT